MFTHLCNSKSCAHEINTSKNEVRCDWCGSSCTMIAYKKTAPIIRVAAEIGNKIENQRTRN